MGPDLVLIRNASYTAGQLSLSQQTGIITLLYKKGKQTYPQKLASNNSALYRLENHV